MVAGELPFSPSQENARKFNKKLIAGISGLLILGCVISTVCISSPQASLSQDSAQLSYLQDSTILTAESEVSHLNFLEMARFEDFDGDYPYDLSSDGKYFAYVSKSRRLIVRSLEDSTKLFDIPYSYGKNYESWFYLSNDSKTLAVVSEDRFLHLVDLNTKSIMVSYEHLYSIRSLVLTHDNKHAFLIQQHSVCLLNLETQTQIYEFRLRDIELRIDATLSEDHQYILVKNEEELRVWNVTTKERILFLYIEEIGCQVQHERFIKQNKYLVLIGEDEVVRVIDLLTQADVFERNVALGWVSDVVYNEEYLAIAGEGGFLVYSLNDWNKIHKSSSSIYYKMTLSRDGKFLVTALTDGTVTVYNFKDETYLNSLAFVQRRYGVTSIRVKDDATIIVFVMDEDSAPKLFSYKLTV